MRRLYLFSLLLAACSSGLPPAGGTAPQPPVAPAPPSGAPAPPVDPPPPAAPTPPADPAPPPDEYEATGVEGDLQVRELGTWAQSPYQRRERQVLRDHESLERLWARLGAQVRPQIDLAQDIVVVAAAGQRPSGGYGIQVRRARLDGRRLLVEVLETSPGPDCLVTASLTQPVQVVRIRGARAEEVEFVERREVRDC